MNYSNEDFTGVIDKNSGLHLAGVNYNSIVDGDGMRLVLFFSGCEHNCIGCHNQKASNFKCGIQFDRQVQSKMIGYLKSTSFIKGLTISGGDPMYSAGFLIPFIRRIKHEVPRVDIWIYSGFTYEQITGDLQMSELLSLCDVLVDGEFLVSLKDESLKFKGSRNQRIIDIKKSERAQSAVLWEG